MIFDFPGAPLGALIAAYFAAKLGRRLSYLVMLISTLTVGTMISSAKYFIAYLIFRLMMGMCLTGERRGLGNVEKRVRNLSPGLFSLLLDLKILL